MRVGKAERTSAPYVEAVLKDFYPSEHVRRSCCRVFADVVRFAHARHPSCWGITLRSGLIRLNVGLGEVCILRHNSVYLVLDKDVLTKEALKQVAAFRRRGARQTYRSVSCPQLLCDVPATRLKEIYPSVREAHRSFIRQAAVRMLAGPCRTSFSFGVVRCLELMGEADLPVPAFWRMQASQERLFPNEIDPGGCIEGARRQVFVNAYERNQAARDKCIAHHGCRCVVCEFDFALEFGEPGQGLIHVHHLKPLSQIGKAYQVDPIKDLCPICPNCHTMAHRKDPPFTLGELKAMRNQARQKRV